MTLRARVLRKAADQIGGLNALSKHLKVPTVDLASWMQGREVPPMAVFLRAVDLLMEEPRVIAGASAAELGRGENTREVGE